MRQLLYPSLQNLHRLCGSHCAKDWPDSLVHRQNKTVGIVGDILSEKNLKIQLFSYSSSTSACVSVSAPQYLSTSELLPDATLSRTLSWHHISRDPRLWIHKLYKPNERLTQQALLLPVRLSAPFHTQRVCLPAQELQCYTAHHPVVAIAASAQTWAIPEWRTLTSVCWRAHQLWRASYPTMVLQPAQCKVVMQLKAETSRPSYERPLLPIEKHLVVLTQLQQNITPPPTSTAAYLSGLVLLAAIQFFNSVFFFCCHAT